MANLRRLQDFKANADAQAASEATLKLKQATKNAAEEYSTIARSQASLAAKCGFENMKVDYIEYLERIIKCCRDYRDYILVEHIRSYEGYIEVRKRTTCKEITKAIGKHLTFEKMLEKILKSDVNFEEIYNNPSKEN